MAEEKDKNQEDRVIENEALRNNDSVDDRKKNDPEAHPEDLPGYPHYKASEDILDPANDVLRVDVDVENISRDRSVSDESIAAGAPGAVDSGMEKPFDPDPEDDELGIVPGTEADVTEDDLIALGELDKDMDLGEDEAILARNPQLMTDGEDLDVPGEELDDANEAIGEEDEENNYYSLGGDDKDGLEDENADTVETQ